MKFVLCKFCGKLHPIKIIEGELATEICPILRQKMLERSLKKEDAEELKLHE